tara:strand:+ start:584 stop:1096 length:513 start_codon:yes stop_codon:yes gene_type:complete
MNKETLLDKFLVKLFRIPAIKNYWSRNFKALEFKNIPWTKLEKPLEECKIVLITTGGIHLKSDKEFDLIDPNGDSTFRRIPYNTNLKDLTITHKYYDHQDADRDPNLILPIEVLSELQSEGIVGPSCENHYSFMGHIREPHLTTLIKNNSVKAAKEISQQKVDIALLVPA